MLHVGILKNEVRIKIGVKLEKLEKNLKYLLILNSLS